VAVTQTSALLRHIRRLSRSDVALTDRQLLERFIVEDDEGAFAELVGRHGALVLNVCRRTLRREQDAEDAFQTTFLVLARKAASIRKTASLASWLYGVAWRSSARLRADLAERRWHEGAVARSGDAATTRGDRVTAPASVVEEPPDPSWREVQELLHEELARLPEKYRAPLVLCYLEGRTQCEAARQLGCGQGVLHGRLDRGRERLRQRLSRRGITLSAALLAAALLPNAPVSAALVEATTRFISGPTSASVAALANAISRGMVIARFKLVVLLVAASLVVTAFGYQMWVVSEPADESPKAAAKSVAEETRPKTDRYGDPLPPQAVARIGTVRWWHGHDRQGCPMVFAPDGKSLVSCDRDKGIRIVDTATGKESRRIEVQGESISCFALSPEGKTIITGSWESPVLRQWDVSTGKELRQIATGAKDTSVLAFSSDGKTLAAVTGQTDIRLWDAAIWKETHQLKGHTGWIGSVLFSPDGKTLISGGGITQTMRWWDVGTGREIKRLNDQSRHYWELGLSPDGKRLAALKSPGVLCLWDAITGDEITRIKEVGCSCLCFSPNSEILACGDGKGRRGNQTLFFAAATGRELRRWDESGYTSRMAFSPNGKILAQAEDGGVIRLRDATTGKPVMEMPLPNRVMTVRFSPDERTLLASCWGGQTGAWQPLTGEQRSPLKGPPEGFAGRADMLLGTALSADGKKAALVDAKGVLHVWDPATAKVYCRISEPLVGEDQADFSPDSNLLVVKHADNVIRLWDTATGKLRCSLPQFGTTRFPHPHAFSPDGRVLATAPSSQDKSVIRLWETATGKELGKLSWQDDSSPSCLAFSPAGKYLVAAHGAGGARTWGFGRSMSACAYGNWPVDGSSGASKRRQGTFGRLRFRRTGRP
jgi:RNA polymerase sigma factor (sigma-70 family)